MLQAIQHNVNLNSTFCSALADADRAIESRLSLGAGERELADLRSARSAKKNGK